MSKSEFHVEEGVSPIEYLETFITTFNSLDKDCPSNATILVTLLHLANLICEFSARLDLVENDPLLRFPREKKEDE